jgi:hypothetical protein
MDNMTTTPPAQRLSIAELSYMAHLSRRRGATLAKRADDTWAPGDLLDTLRLDTATLADLLTNPNPNPERLGASMADLLWALLILADERNVDLATAFDARIAEVVTDIRHKLLLLDTGQALS